MAGNIPNSQEKSIRVINQEFLKNIVSDRQMCTHNKQLSVSGSEDE